MSINTINSEDPDYAYQPGFSNFENYSDDIPEDFLNKPANHVDTTEASTTTTTNRTTTMTTTTTITTTTTTTTTSTTTITATSTTTTTTITTILANTQELTNTELIEEIGDNFAMEFVQEDFNIPDGILMDFADDPVDLGVHTVFAGHFPHTLPAQYPVEQSVPAIHSTQVPFAALHTEFDQDLFF